MGGILSVCTKTVEAVYVHASKKKGSSWLLQRHNISSLFNQVIKSVDIVNTLTL
jgi:hypothetical protein